MPRPGVNNMINSQEPLLAPRKAPLVGNFFKVGMKDHVHCQNFTMFISSAALDAQVEVKC